MTPAQIEWEIICNEAVLHPERFIARLSRMTRVEGSCRIWAGTLNNKGYGRLGYNWNGRRIALCAHRVFLTLKLRHPIPDGYEAAHYQCFNRACVEHVYLEEVPVNRADANRTRKRSHEPQERESHVAGRATAEAQAEGWGVHGM